MGKFRSLPDTPEMIEVFRRFPQGLTPLCDYLDVVLRAESPLTVAERELIATYVSGLNLCNFCYGAHRDYALSHGIDPELFEQLMDDPRAAGVDEKLLPLFAYVKKLTLTPSQMTDSDAEAVYAAGWDEDALYNAVTVCAIFNCMNRIVEGCGITPKEMFREQSRERMRVGRDNPNTYADFAKLVLEGA